MLVVWGYGRCGLSICAVYISTGCTIALSVITKAFSSIPFSFLGMPQVAAPTRFLFVILIKVCPSIPRVMIVLVWIAIWIIRTIVSGLHRGVLVRINPGLGTGVMRCRFWCVKEKRRMRRWTTFLFYMGKLWIISCRARPGWGRRAGYDTIRIIFACWLPRQFGIGPHNTFAWMGEMTNTVFPDASRYNGVTQSLLFWIDSGPSNIIEPLGITVNFVFFCSKMDLQTLHRTSFFLSGHFGGIFSEWQPREKGSDWQILCRYTYLSLSQYSTAIIFVDESKFSAYQGVKSQLTCKSQLLARCVCCNLPPPEKL